MHPASRRAALPLREGAVAGARLISRSAPTAEGWARADSQADCCFQAAACGEKDETSRSAPWRSRCCCCCSRRTPQNRAMAAVRHQLRLLLRLLPRCRRRPFPQIRRQKLRAVCTARGIATRRCLCGAGRVGGRGREAAAALEEAERRRKLLSRRVHRRLCARIERRGRVVRRVGATRRTQLLEASIRDGGDRGAQVAAQHGEFGRALAQPLRLRQGVLRVRSAQQGRAHVLTRAHALQRRTHLRQRLFRGLQTADQELDAGGGARVASGVSMKRASSPACRLVPISPTLSRALSACASAVEVVLAEDTPDEVPPCAFGATAGAARLPCSVPRSLGSGSDDSPPTEDADVPSRLMLLRTSLLLRPSAVTERLRAGREI